MNFFLDDKIQMIDNYIQNLTKSIDSNDIAAAKDLQDEIIAVYSNELEEIRTGLDNYSPGMSRSVDFLGDAKKLRAKLQNYRINLLSGLHDKFQSDNNLINVTQNVHQNVQNNISISLEQTVSDINSLPQESLSDEDKEILCGKLVSLSAEKSKESKWEKAQGVLKWIAEKGFDVAKIVLPYILQSVFNTTV